MVCGPKFEILRKLKKRIVRGSFESLVHVSFVTLLSLNFRMGKSVMALICGFKTALIKTFLADH